MRGPRFPLRWSHRIQRMIVPRTWQGRAVQAVIVFAGMVAYVWVSF